MRLGTFEIMLLGFVLVAFFTTKQFWISAFEGMLGKK